MGMEQLVEKYFRPGRLPHIWCPGCGNGVITGAIVKAVDKQGLSKDEVALISGIGCSSRSSRFKGYRSQRRRRLHSHRRQPPDSCGTPQH